MIFASRFMRPSSAAAIASMFFLASQSCREVKTMNLLGEAIRLVLPVHGCERRATA
jgi:hypothetical protein